MRRASRRPPEEKVRPRRLDRSDRDAIAVLDPQAIFRRVDDREALDAEHWAHGGDDVSTLCYAWLIPARLAGLARLSFQRCEETLRHR